MEPNMQPTGPAAPTEQPKQVKPNQGQVPPKKSGGGAVVVWSIVIIIVLIVLAYLLMFFQSLGYRPLGIPVINNSNSSSSEKSIAIVERSSNSNSSTSVSYGGSWNLQVLSNSTTTGVGPSLLKTTGTGTVDFDMPNAEGGKFTASGPWSSKGSGTVGPSSATASITGKISLTGEIKSGKLHFTITYTEEECPVTIVTPIGSSTTNNCDPNNVPDIHTIDIDIKDGAAASSTVTRGGMAAGYSFTGTENWTLTEKE